MAHYVWWKTPEEAAADPARLIAQVMNIGRFEDVCRLFREVGRPTLRRIVENAEPGWFSQKPWAFWHVVLKIGDRMNPPPLPQRRLPPGADRELLFLRRRHA